MSDIKTALNNLAGALREYTLYREVEAMEPFIVTPGTTGRSLSRDISLTGVKVSYISIYVRSMGTATYIAIGRPGSQEERLTAVGDVLEIEAPHRTYINIGKVLIISDASDAVVEVGGVLIPAGVSE